MATELDTHNVGDDKGPPINFFDPNTVEQGDVLLRRSLKPYGKMTCGKDPMMTTTIVISNCEEWGLGSVFDRLCRDSPKRVQDGFRLPKAVLKAGVEAAVMEPLRGEHNETSARVWYKDLGDDGPATHDGKDNQVALLMTIVTAFLELPEMAPLVADVDAYKITCDTLPRVAQPFAPGRKLFSPSRLVLFQAHTAPLVSALAHKPWSLSCPLLRRTQPTRKSPARIWVLCHS